MLLVNRFTSLVVAAGYVVVAAFAIGWTPDSWLITAGLTLPLALIWYPDEMGELAGYYPGHMRQPTPAVVIVGCGWLVLIGTLAIYFCLGSAS